MNTQPEFPQRPKRPKGSERFSDDGREEVSLRGIKESLRQWGESISRSSVRAQQIVKATRASWTAGMFEAAYTVFPSPCAGHSHGHGTHEEPRGHREETPCQFPSLPRSTPRRGRGRGPLAVSMGTRREGTDLGRGPRCRSLLQGVGNGPTRGSIHEATPRESARVRTRRERKVAQPGTRHSSGKNSQSSHRNGAVFCRVSQPSRG